MRSETVVHDVLNEVVFNQPSARATTESAEPPALWRRARTWWVRMLRLRLRAPRRLRLCESLPLGERRFVAVVEFERSRFLVGGTSASLVLLARLGKVQDQDDDGPTDGPTDRPAGVFRESHN